MKKLLLAILILFISSATMICAQETITIYGTTINLPDKWDNFLSEEFYPIGYFYLTEEGNIFITAIGTDPGWPVTSSYAVFIDFTDMEKPKLVGIARCPLGIDSKYQHYLINPFGDLVYVEYDEFIKTLTTPKTDI